MQTIQVKKISLLSYIQADGDICTINKDHSEFKRGKQTQ